MINDVEFNNEVLYPITAETTFEPTVIPLINNISMFLPSTPPMFNWDALPKVKKLIFSYKYK